MTFSFLRRAARTLLVAAIVGLMFQTAQGQGITTGSISGSVADPTGALIPGATVTATDLGTNHTVKTTTGKDGSFSFKDLEVG